MQTFLNAIKIATMTLLLLLIACKNDTELKINEPILNIGDYFYPDGIRLKVYEDNRLIKYTLKNASGELMIQSKDNASSLHRWIIVWDGNRLWFTSSDIGSIVWIEEEGIFAQNTYMNDKPMLKSNAPEGMKIFNQRFYE